jgi:hypothetical protein
VPKYTFQWKDPDYDDGDPHGQQHGGMSDEEHKKLRRLGAREYLIVEFDTDAMTATVRGVKP